MGEDRRFDRVTVRAADVWRRSVQALLAKARTAHVIDIVVRKDGREFRFEGDWIKRLEVEADQEPPTSV